MEFTIYNLEEIKNKIKEFGVPKNFSAFGNQVSWELAELEEGEDAIESFIDFLESWNITEICPAGQWGRSAGWSLLGTGLGIANVTWDYELAESEENNYVGL